MARTYSISWFIFFGISFISRLSRLTGISSNLKLQKTAHQSGLPIFLAIQLRLFLPQRQIPQLNPKRKRDSLYIILPIQTKFSSSILSELTTSHSKTWSSLHYSLTVLQENEVEHKEPIIQREQLDLPFTSQSEGKKFLQEAIRRPLTDAIID